MWLYIKRMSYTVIFVDENWRIKKFVKLQSIDGNSLFRIQVTEQASTQLKHSEASQGRASAGTTEVRIEEQ